MWRGVVTVYKPNSHADVILTRLLETDTLDGQGRIPELELVSLYCDQTPANDMSRTLAEEHGFQIFDTIAGALTLGGDELAVDGVVMIAEHGDYPRSDTGQRIYPKRRLFGGIVDVFRASSQAVPVFSDKHLADNWDDAEWFYETARELQIPLMAGSSLPTTWRRPVADVEQDAELEEMIAIGYGGLDSYGFHALEMAQCLAERRQGGETGVRRVRCYEGPDVWSAGEDGVYDLELLRVALDRQQVRPVAADVDLGTAVSDPVLFAVEYRDGLRLNVFMLNGLAREFSVAWRTADQGTGSTLFWLQESRPFHHFAHLVAGIEQHMATGRPPYPVERTLLTSGILDAALVSRRDDGVTIETPWLDIEYSTDWTWQQPPPPPEPH